MDLSSDEEEPAGQSLHVLLLYALTWSEYFPAPQSTHSADPAVGLYFADAQPTQSTFVPVNPASQTQAVSEMLSAGEMEFGGQRRHCGSSSDK